MKLFALGESMPSEEYNYGDYLRITSCISQGGRRYMEDAVKIHVQRNETGKIEFVFAGVFDGHGGYHASHFTRKHLMDNIVCQKAFYSDNDEEVLRAIKEGFSQTHLAMWKEVESWPRTASGYTSTSGTTASVVFIRNGKMYVGHVGDSAVVLGKRASENSGRGVAPMEIKSHATMINRKARVMEGRFQPYPNLPTQTSLSQSCDLAGGRKSVTAVTAIQLTTDHKPDSPEEFERIRQAGGAVAIKSGVVRVVWARPRPPSHTGPIRRSTPMDRIPFLAVARSLGDLWSYNPTLNEFIVSPEPELQVVPIDQDVLCLVLGSDGIWNVVRPIHAVGVVKSHEWKEIYGDQDLLRRESDGHPNHARWLVRHTLLRWGCMRADNISVVSILFDHPPCPGRSSPDFTGESVGGCVLRTLPDRELAVDQILGEDSDLMVRIEPATAQLLQTQPVELVYFGEIDSGAVGRLLPTRSRPPKGAFVTTSTGANLAYGSVTSNGATKHVAQHAARFPPVRMSVILNIPLESGFSLQGGADGDAPSVEPPTPTVQGLPP